MLNVQQLLCNVYILSTFFVIMKGYDLMCTCYILVRYTSHLIMCTVGSICIIFDFTNKTFHTTLFSNVTYFRNNIQTDEYRIHAELSTVIESLHIHKLSLNKT